MRKTSWWFTSFLLFCQIDGKPVLKFAAAYGFRNIQNLVQKMKRGRCSYHFVEVMACPSGTSYLQHFIISLASPWTLFRNIDSAKNNCWASSLVFTPTSPGTGLSVWGESPVHTVHVQCVLGSPPSPTHRDPMAQSIHRHASWNRSIVWYVLSLPGCLNGGGQILAADGETTKELLTKLEAVYNSAKWV